MRTLICEGIETLIVEESRLLFLGLEVFSLWDSSSNNPKRDGQDIFLVEGINARIFRNAPCARFLVSLETTRARQEYGTALGHWALPLPAHGLESVRPNVVKVHCAKFCPFTTVQKI